MTTQMPSKGASVNVARNVAVRWADNVEYGFDPHDDSDYLHIVGNDVWGNGEPNQSLSLSSMTLLAPSYLSSVSCLIFRLSLLSCRCDGWSVIINTGQKEDGIEQR